MASELPARSLAGRRSLAGSASETSDADSPGWNGNPLWRMGFQVGAGGDPMSTLRRRLADIEEQKAFRDWQEREQLFKGRSRDELMFFSVYGYFPESREGQT